MHNTFTLSAVLGTFALATQIHAASTVVIDYQLTEGSASISPITLPNPTEGGADLEVAPVLTIESGSFQAVFENGNSAGEVDSGPTTIRNMEFEGTFGLEVTSEIDVGLFSFNVTAELGGPIIGSQVSDASGSILLGTVFSNADPGNFNIVLGPIDCDDSTPFDLLCGLLGTTLNLDFPIELPALDDAPLPFTGLFNDLDKPGESTVGNSINFGIPLGEDNEFGTDVEFQWTEYNRTVVVPEPSVALLLPLALTVLARRRRTH